jgi:hypothetical protein
VSWFRKGFGFTGTVALIARRSTARRRVGTRALRNARRSVRRARSVCRPTRRFFARPLSSKYFRNSRPNSNTLRRGKGAQSLRAASLRPASVALSRARRSKPGHAELVRSTDTLPSVHGVETGGLLRREARPDVVSSSVRRGLRSGILLARIT